MRKSIKLLLINYHMKKIIEDTPNVCKIEVSKHFSTYNNEIVETGFWRSVQ